MSENMRVNTAAEKTIRAFLAVDLPAEIKTTLGRVQDRLRTLIPDVRWSRPEAIHLTLQFFGYIPPDHIESISETVKKNVEGIAPFMLHLGPPGAFPSITRPRVAYIGLGGDTEVLCRLQAQIAGDLNEIGFKKEERAFAAHLTLGRLKSATKLSGVPDAFKKIINMVAGSFAVDRLRLFRSDLKPTGAVYTVLEDYPFGGGK